MTSAGPWRSRAPFAPAWLTARPIAHRGLHDRDAGRIENTVSAASAAIAQHFAIECDLQRTADGEAVVFHDFTLERLTDGSGPVEAMPAEALAAVGYRDTPDRIATLASFLAHIGGRAPLICEIKSRFDGDMRLVDRVAGVIADYDGPLAVKSFDPAVIAHFRDLQAGAGARTRPLGIVAQARYDDPDWAHLTAFERFALANLLHFRETRPDFLSYHVDDLPHGVPFLCRHGMGAPVMAWTVRSPAQRAIAAEQADQIVFEGFAA